MLARFGIFCPPIPGHINPFCVLGRALIQRGHRVTVFGVVDAAPMVKQQGLDFVALGASDFPAGSLARTVEELKLRSGFRSTQFAVQAAAKSIHLILKHAPASVSDASIDAILADQNEPAGATVAEHLQLPFASICTSLPLNREPAIPPTFVSWSFQDGFAGRLRNRMGYRVADFITRSLNATLNEYRQRWKLSLLRSSDDSFSLAAQIAQMPRAFDFPRRNTPAHFYYTGPWFDEVLEKLSTRRSFPFDQLDGRRLIYASLGTLQSSNNRHFHTIAEACSGLDSQVVISVGSAEGSELPRLPGNHLVVRYAPQIELLKRAALTITHGGMNTTMQALQFGSPMVAIPLAHDQPAIAARLERTGAGLVIPPGKLNPTRLREAIDSMLAAQNPWQMQAQRMQRACQEAGGVERAASLVEQAMGKGRVKSAKA